MNPYWVDNGLRRIGGRRLPTAVLDVDLPGLARAITSAMRGQAASQIFDVEGIGYVRITGRGIDASVTATDWEKVLVSLRDETLTTSIFPVESGPKPIDSEIRLSSSTVDARDPLYTRVYGLLGQLFTTKVPT